MGKEKDRDKRADRREWEVREAGEEETGKGVWREKDEEVGRMGWRREGRRA